MTTPHDRGPQDNSTGFLARLAEQFSQQGARTVYGDPVERNGVTIIPVARVRSAFGGGAGRGQDREARGSGEGGGAGGALLAVPVGYIEVRESGSRFQPIRLQPPLYEVAGLVIAAGFASTIVLRGLRRLLRSS